MPKGMSNAIWALVIVVAGLLVACTPRTAQAPTIAACQHDDGAVHDGDAPQAYPCQWDSVTQDGGSPVGPYGTRYTRYQEGTCSRVPDDVTCIDVSEWE